MQHKSVARDKREAVQHGICVVVAYVGAPAATFVPGSSFKDPCRVKQEIQRECAMAQRGKKRPPVGEKPPPVIADEKPKKAKLQSGRCICSLCGTN